MSEFSRIVTTDRISAKPLREQITATPEECAALAERFGLVALEDFTAEITLKRISPSRVIRASGRLKARLVQECVVSLEPVAEAVEAKFEAFFEEVTDKKDIFSSDDSGESVPEPIGDARIDIGELAAQNLSVAINPYPRAEKAVLMPVDADKQALFETPATPFAALTGLKNVKKGE